MEMKGRFPFRIGSTSWVMPADIVTNVRHCAPLVDDIELVLFESGDLSPLPDPGIVAELGKLAARHGISYTVHLPLDISFGDPAPAVRCESVRKCFQGIAATRGLDPFAYILHCTCQSGTGPDDAWHRNVCSSVEALLATGIEPRTLCVENLGYPFAYVERIAADSGTSICCDLGHLQLHERAMLHDPVRLLKKCRVAHLHGVASGKDHRAVLPADCGEYAAILSALQKGEAGRVVTMEVFSKSDLEQSLSSLKEYWSCQN